MNSSIRLFEIQSIFTEGNFGHKVKILKRYLFFAKTRAQELYFGYLPVFF